MDAGTLQKAIAEVCPVISTKVEDANNRSSWSFEPEGAATQPEIDAGNNVIQTIPIATVPPVEPAGFINRFTDAEYLLLKQMHAANLTANDASNIKIWDMVIGRYKLDLNSPDAKALKAELVSDGVLSQARADEIFGTTALGQDRF